MLLQNIQARATCYFFTYLGTWITSAFSGSPLTQMMTYALHHDSHEMIDKRMITFLIESIPDERFWERGETTTVTISNFDHSVLYIRPGPVEGDRDLMCSPVHLAIQLQRTDIAKLFVQAGANPIHAENSSEPIIPLICEFYEFGTNHFISWLLHKHKEPHQISGFIQKVLEMKPMIFSQSAKDKFKNEAGRHHVHAFLTCGHKEMIQEFIERFPTTDENEDTLRVKDPADRTALQIAAANNDLESVDTLLSK